MLRRRALCQLHAGEVPRVRMCWQVAADVLCLIKATARQAGQPALQLPRVVNSFVEDIIHQHKHNKTALQLDAGDDSTDEQEDLSTSA